MEFLPVVALVLGVYAAFVMLFFRFLSLMHKKEQAVVRHGGSRF
jgi:hypothetical protein